MDQRLTKQHFSARVFANYLEYLRARHPHIDVKSLVEEAGLSLEYLQNDSHWVSTEFDTKFTKIAIEKTGEPDLCHKVGLFAIDNMNKWIRPIYLFLKYGTTFHQFFSLLKMISARFSKVTELVIKRNHPGLLVLTLQLKTNYLSEEEKGFLRQNFYNIARNQLAFIEFAPKIYGKKSVQVQFTVSENENKEPEGEYTVLYNYGAFREFVHSGIKVAFALGIGAWFASTTSLAPSQEAAIFMGVFSSYLLLKLWHLRKALTYTDQTLTHLDKQYADLRASKNRIESLNLTYSRYVPKQLISLLKKESITQIQLGNHKVCNLAALFLDVRQFTTISERIGPHKTFEFVNQLFSFIAPPVENHGGFIESYTGDGFFAIFPNGTIDAINTAIEIHNELGKYQGQWARQIGHEIRIGIGIHRGTTIVGTVGYEDRMQGTVISDIVNSASRIQELNKVLGTTILVAEEALANQPLGIRHRNLGHFRIRGKNSNVPIVEVYESDPAQLAAAKEAQKANFKHALQCKEAGNYVEAQKTLKEILLSCPSDEVVKYLLAQLPPSKKRAA